MSIQIDSVCRIYCYDCSHFCFIGPSIAQAHDGDIFVNAPTGVNRIKLRLRASRRAGFVAEAQAAREQLLKTGKGYDADEVHAHLKARIAGEKSAKPKAKSWRS